MRAITKDLFYVGADNIGLNLFENIYPLTNGVSYNSYLLIDDKTVLFDTVDETVRETFLSQVQQTLNGRSLDYLVIHHMEPDHCALIKTVVELHPEITLICNAKTQSLLNQFFEFDPCPHYLIVKEGDTFATAHHTFHFVMAPMVHWPEVMMSFDEKTGILFAADAFGTFNALTGNLYADEVPFESDWLEEARRYYANIVGKYGMQVQNILKKASQLPIRMICPLHGPIWRKNIPWFIEKYQRWSCYMPEEQAVVIMVATIYGHTLSAAQQLADLLGERGIKNIRLYDLSATHPSRIVSEVFRASHLVFAGVTYNMGLFPPMETLLDDLIAHNVQGRTVALMENGSWAPVAGKLMKEKISCLKNIHLIEPVLTIKSAFKKSQQPDLEKMADCIARDIGG